MVRYCKEELHFDSVSIVSNGSLIEEDWFPRYGQYLDILAISCDSFVDKTNHKIGRRTTSTRKTPTQLNHREKMMKIKEWCDKYRVVFKINSVINKFNKDEDMTDHIKQLDPKRWKVFQCLILKGENSGGAGDLRDAREFVISDEDFKSFLHRHHELECLVPEDNETMRDSYLILDEQMRFLDCTGGAKVPSESILKVGVNNAIQHSGFDPTTFISRLGIYEWDKNKVLRGAGPQADLSF
ncbi:hypothetical protein SAMD00019534_115750 [Acytostelium subglobosum LB1]|uniref:hypothetical protein n=1 Tax=Acytostelium subglobosum LB1 TaxID=1410327 RepID=UPI0006450F52|nr:hypothetical protein SAMD00019534_115750 [Acytostelium subglobosum LB1]GAM28399.1 hypothetical protein SAMD00019534_115750 [Acytostelium subglobosum LB1]|eukprot:XP_012748716.1 hypothetical protein SAMD00019534_115750 [Acytostelium subglobosum LB1]